MNGFSKASAVSLQLFLEESGVHTGMQYTTKCSCSSLSRTFNNYMADGIFFYCATVSLKFILSFKGWAQTRLFRPKENVFHWGIWIRWLRKNTFWSVQGSSKKTMTLVERGFVAQCGHGSIWGGVTKEPDLRQCGRTDLFLRDPARTVHGGLQPRRWWNCMFKVSGRREKRPPVKARQVTLNLSFFLLVCHMSLLFILPILKIYLA